MISTLVVAALVSILGKFMADEVKSWASWIHGRLRRFAVSRLPQHCRERYEEEWESGLAEIPGEIFRFIYSLGLIWAAGGIRRASLNMPNGVRLTAKRLFDVWLSSLAIAAMAAPLVLIVIAIKLESRGPVLHRVKRVGRHGKAFNCFRFRTLAINESGKPRVTTVGRFLRLTSLSMIPQFFNVLRGEMSIVGPPALPVAEAKRYEFSRVFEIAPGLTSISVLQAIEDSSSEADLSLDEAYAEKLSLRRDLMIIVRTIWMVLTGRP